MAKKRSVNYSKAYLDKAKKLAKSLTQQNNNSSKSFSLNQASKIVKRLTQQGLYSRGYNKKKPPRVHSQKIQTDSSFEQTQLPFEIFEQTQIPSDLFEQTQLPSDLFEQPNTPINQEPVKDLLTKAIRMIDNAERGVLVDINGQITKDFNVDLERMQRVFDAVELHRINALASGRGKGVDVRVSSKDIKAVMFKPIIRLELMNPNVVTGRTQFTRLWNFTKVTLYDDLDNLSEEKIKTAYQRVYDRISSFEEYILSTLSDNPKEWNNFIEAILDTIPTAFGPPSP